MAQAELNKIGPVQGPSKKKVHSSEGAERLWCAVPVRHKGADAEEARVLGFGGASMAGGIRIHTGGQARMDADA